MGARTEKPKFKFIKKMRAPGEPRSFHCGPCAATTKIDKQQRIYEETLRDSSQLTIWGFYIDILYLYIPCFHTIEQY